MDELKTDTINDISKISESNFNKDLRLIAKNAAQLCNETRLDIVEIIEALEPSLTHKSPSERATGTGLLADIFRLLNKTLLSPEQLDLVFRFCCDRLRDQHSVVPKVIEASLALVTYNNVKDEHVIDFLQELFLNVQCQSQVMSDRRNIYTLFKFCTTNKLYALKKMGQDFTYGFLTAMDGEKDPRNLVLLFSFYPIIVREISLGPFTEEMFEVVAAYFPIDFVPPTNDPAGITAEDLIDGLRTCLASSSKFGQYALPLLQEKLDSDINSAKIDALHTLIKCCGVYGLADIHTNLVPLWNSIKREAIENVDSDLEATSLSALSALLRTYEDGPATVEMREGLVQQIEMTLTECLGHLATPEQRLMFPSSRILLAISAGGVTASIIVGKKVLPLLIGQYETTHNVNSKKNIISISSLFLSSCGSYNNIFNDNPDLDGFKNELWQLYTSGISNSDSQTLKETCILACCPLIPFYTHDKSRQLATLLVTVLTDKETIQTVQTAAVNCIVAVAKHNPSAVNEIIIPDVITKMSCDVTYDVDVIVSITVTSETAIYVIKRLWDAVNGWRATSQVTACDVRYFDCINKIICKMKHEKEFSDYVSKEWNALPEVLLISLTTYRDTKDVATLHNTLYHLSSLCRSVVAITHRENLERIKELIRFMFNLSENGLVSDLLGVSPEIYSISKSLKDAGHSTVFLVYILEGLVLNLPNDFVLADCFHWCKLLLKWSLGCELPEKCREVAAILLATIINKLPDGQELTDIENYVRIELKNILISDTTNIKQIAYSTWLWMTKACVIREYIYYEEYTNISIKLLRDKEIGEAVANGFKFVLEDHQYAFTSVTNPRLRLFYRQRFFEVNLKKLMTLYEDEGEAQVDLSSSNAIGKELSSSDIENDLNCTNTPKEQSNLTNQANSISSLENTIGKELSSSNGLSSSYIESSTNTPNNHSSSTNQLNSISSSFTKFNNETSKQNEHKKIHQNALLAVTCMLPNLPNQVLNTHIRDLLPLLIQGLKITESTIQSEIVKTLYTLLKHSPQSAIPHINTLIPSLLNLTVRNPIKIRVNSAECIGTFAGLDTRVILPYKLDVVNGLKPVLNDHKRLVRMAAAKSRSLWVLVGSV